MTSHIANYKIQFMYTEVYHVKQYYKKELKHFSINSTKINGPKLNHSQYIVQFQDMDTLSLVFKEI